MPKDEFPLTMNFDREEAKLMGQLLRAEMYRVKGKLEMVREEYERETHAVPKSMMEDAVRVAQQEYDNVSHLCYSMEGLLEEEA